MIAFACDLDNTLIYSYKKLLSGRVLVEEKDGKALSYMTEYSYEKLLNLSSQVRFIPVTTRSLEQYERIRLPIKPVYALAANGGILLIDGKPDPKWYEESRQISKAAEKEFKKALGILEQDPNLSLEPRMVDGLFLFTKSSCEEETMAALKAGLKGEQLFVYSNGQKVYAVPGGLDKGRRLRDLKKRLGNPYLVACGDSLFDVPMLAEADFAIYPQELEVSPMPGQKQYAVPEGGMFSDEIFRQIKKLLAGGSR